MSQAPAVPAPALARVVCAHCGLTVPPVEQRPGDPLQFCCGGCRQVYHILHETGLQGYYDVRQRTGSPGIPARVGGRAFQDFDDPLFQERYVQPTATGLCSAELYLEGVHCAACAWLVEQLPQVRPGLVSSRLDLARARVQVQWDPTATTLSAVARGLDRMGYTPHPWREADLAGIRSSEDRSFLFRLGLAAAGSMNIMFLQVALYAGEGTTMDPSHAALLRWSTFLTAIPVVGWSAIPFFRSAWQGLVRRVPHIDLPIAVAIGAGFLASAWNTFRGQGPLWFDSLSMLVALLLAGRWLQSRAQRKALQTAERLHGGVALDFARRLEPDGPPREIPMEAVRPGDLLEVKPGERIPADGVVVHGQSQTDNSALTGEATPCPVEPGSPVHAWTVNLGAPLQVQATAVGLDTRVGGLLALVEEARRRQAPLVALTDRIGRVFVLAVVVLALGAGAAWIVLDPAHALERVIALLVVSCPCALGLATPVAMTTALTQAAEAGIYIKGADVLQTLSRVREVVLDKTGTLTEGRFRLERWTGSPQGLALAAALARGSTHPLARALALATPTPASVVFTREEPGRGMEGLDPSGRAVVVGNLPWLQAHGVELDKPDLDLLLEVARQGLTPVLVAIGGRLDGLAACGDPMRPEAPQVLQRLKSAGWRVRLLSGDHPEAVAALGTRLGLAPADVQGGVSPEEKHAIVSRAVESANQRGHAVMMVGDGINDAAALAAAHVGVCVHGGSGASIQAADVVLTRAGLHPLVHLEQGSRAVLSTIWRNLIFSLLYNLTGISLALVGLVGPLLAAVLMPISSLTVIGSSVATRAFSRRDRWT